ncbi:MAG: hypothetical protein KKD75_03595, partial [Nanoarchaeota archaeon]|nr:hypothetical protein [Nanoarchaeota archaeon]MBU1632375.1 hypothetical protein [Nanoarchaeota archaeon]MBU1876723.1 hypothetical protein [Nanoarchaeota archaeon]
MKRTKRNGWKRTKHDPHLKTFLIVFTALVGIVLLVSGLSLTISSQENSFTYNIIQNSIREISDQLTGFAVSIPQGQGIGINGTIEEMINKTSTIDETPAIDKTITTPDKIVEPQLIQSADTSGGQLGILAAPTINSIILNTTNPSTNDTAQNLTVNVTTSDIDGDPVKVIYNWYKDGTSIAVLNMPFENNTVNVSNSTKDYSGYGNNGTVTGAVWNATGGYDGKGAYQFNSSGDYITVPNINLNASNNDFSVFLWAKIGQHDLYKKIIHKKG